MFPGCATHPHTAGYAVGRVSRGMVPRTPRPELLSLILAPWASIIACRPPGSMIEWMISSALAVTKMHTKIARGTANAGARHARGERKHYPPQRQCPARPSVPHALFYCAFALFWNGLLIFNNKVI